MFRRVIETCSNAVLVVDEDATIRHAFGAIQAVHGVPPSDLVSRRVFDFIHTDDIEPVRAGLDAARAHPAMPTALFYRAHHRDLGWRWVKATATNHLGDDVIEGLVLFEEHYALPHLAPTDVAGDGDTQRYRIIRSLHGGGMAEVLLAVQNSLGGFEKLVALKRIRRELLERTPDLLTAFVNEARLAATLTHPGIAQVYELADQGGELFIAMEYVHGVDLARVLGEARAAGERLSLPEALHIAVSVGAALDYAHRAKDVSGQPLRIVHRDVSPANIMITHDGFVKLVDFGVALAIGQTDRLGGAGKPSYMSPEQRRRQALDERSDVYSLGMVLRELLLGELPSSPGDEVLAGQMPGPIAVVVQRAVTADPNDRYASAAELIEALLGLGAAGAAVDVTRALAARVARSAGTPPSIEETLRAAGRTTRTGSGSHGAR